VVGQVVPRATTGRGAGRPAVGLFTPTRCGPVKEHGSHGRHP